MHKIKTKLYRVKNANERCKIVTIVHKKER